MNEWPTLNILRIYISYPVVNDARLDFDFMVRFMAEQVVYLVGDWLRCYLLLLKNPPEFLSQILPVPVRLLTSSYVNNNQIDAVADEAIYYFHGREWWMYHNFLDNIAG